MPNMYKVIATEGTRVLATRWAGSMAQVKEHKTALKEKYALGAKNLDYEEVSVATDKASVLEKFNDLELKADAPVDG